VSEQPSLAVILTAQTMAVDQMTCEVVTAFRAAAIPVVLLKGPSIAQWLYPSGGRVYGDSDLLVSPQDFSRATRVLGELGFGEPMRGRAAHAHTYRRRDSSVGHELCVDLHRSLPFVTVAPEDVWRILSAGAGSITIGGTRITVMDTPQRALHIAIHAAQHLFDSTKPLEDLQRAIEVVEYSDWEAAATLSKSLGAEDALAAGLGLVPEGRDLAERLALTQRRRGMLRIASSPRSEGAAYEVQRVLDAPSFRERVKLISDGVLISPAAMRHASPIARRGRGGLVLAYVLRPFQLAKRLVPALVTRKRILKSP
jgi:hypothetical protein